MKHFQRYVSIPRLAAALCSTTALASPMLVLQGGVPLVHRIAKLDVPGRLAGTVPGWAAKAACAILGIGLAVVLRAMVDLVAPGVAPYAFIYPAALLATLLGGWQAGTGTMLGSGLLAWMFVVPPGGAVRCIDELPTGGPRRSRA